MNKDQSPASSAGQSKVSGTVRDTYQRPLPKATVRGYNKGIRDLVLLGETTTDAAGNYSLSYTSKNPAGVALVVQVFDAGNKLLVSSDVQFNPPSLLTLDLSLAGQPYAGPSEFEQVVKQVMAAAGDLALPAITETAANPEISFIIQKTGLTRELVEKVVMASRFASWSSVPTDIWYGILRTLDLSLSKMGISASTDLETRLTSIYDQLMRTSADPLVSAVRQAIGANIIAFSFTAGLDTLGDTLTRTAADYAQKHPVTGQPSVMVQAAQIAGAAAGASAAAGAGFKAAAVAAPAPDAVKAVQQVASLVGNNMTLTASVVKGQAIQTPADVKKLAALTAADWDAMLAPSAGATIAKAAVATGSATASAAGGAATTGSAATVGAAGSAAPMTGAQLEQAFTAAFPTAAFAARLQKDTASKVPVPDKVAQFLQQHDSFDLANTKVGQFLNDNKSLVADTDAPALAAGLRKVQRVFKLSPHYDHVNLLLNNNIHSAHQVVRMGKEPFVARFGTAMGTQTAEAAFDKASTVHANTVALVGNLKSMSDASAMNAFPDFAQAIQTTLGTELPNLDTLFGHADFCECDECSSVYGAPAYLTDILHFLDNRFSNLQLPNKPNSLFASVKDILLRRRPDIGDIDLNCANSNTEVPYIDIACEIMEDFIAPPVITIDNSLSTQIKTPGPIDKNLLSAILQQFTATGQSNVAAKLTQKATVSEVYGTTQIKPDNTFVTRESIMIRDKELMLKIMGTDAGTWQAQVLHETLQDSATIGAAPEYVNVNAYNALKAAKRSLALPFDLFGMEAELFLEKAGTSRSELIDLFRTPDGQPAGQSPTDLLEAAVALGISENEQTLIFQPDVANQKTYWGIDLPTDGSAITVEFDVFEQLTGLDFDGIDQLRRCGAIGFSSAVQITRDGVTCDTDKMHITGLTAANFDVIHRFLRLWRKTDMTLEEVNAIVVSAAAGNGVIDNKIVWHIRQIQALRDTLNLSVADILVFYQDLETSLFLKTSNQYLRLFQNSALTNPVNPDFTLQRVASVAAPPLVTDAHKAILAAVTQIPVSDVNLLLPAANTRLSLSNISLVYRHAILSRALRISVTDLLAAMQLIDVKPFQDPTSTVRFITKYKTLQFSGWSTSELSYLLLNQDDSRRPLTPTDAQASTALAGLQDELLAARVATQPAPDPTGALLTKWLSDPVLHWDDTLLTRLLDILSTGDDASYQAKVDANTNFLLNLRIQYVTATTAVNLAVLPTSGTPAVAITLPANLAGQLSYDANRKQLVLRGVISPADLAALNALSKDQPWVSALASLPVGALTTDAGENNVLFATAGDITALRNLLSANIADRYAFFLNPIAPIYRRIQQRNILVHDISSWFNIDATVAGRLLDAATVITRDLTDDAFVNRQAPAGTTTFPVQMARYRMVAKTCFALGKLKPDDVLLSLLLTKPGAYGLLDLLNLPATGSTNSGLTGFAAWENLINLLRVEALYPPVAVPGGPVLTIYTLLSDLLKDVGADLTAFRNDLIGELGLLMGWKMPDLGALLALVFPTPATVQTLSASLQRLYRCVVILQAAGASVADVISWCKNSLTVDDTTSVKSRIKSRFNASDWQSLSTALENTLREKKRDALIAYLLANPGSNGWKTTNDLFDYFLLDVEMCSCRPTSRIVEATNAVQLFVQRCHLSLESSIMIDSSIDSAWLQWSWMKYFRLWQANVKVFLYPENYIEPELLPSTIKSSFLQDLENDLLQNEVTADNVETAFQNYLHKLDGVARLEIKGMFFDDFNATLHVIGRTYGGDPRIYYYRTYDGRRWTPWSKIDLEINTDHILPVVYNNHVYLFWALFSENPEQPTTVTVPPAPGAAQSTFTIQQPVKNWTIQMAFSEFKNGKWTPKKVSNQDATGQLVTPQSAHLNKASFFFVPLDLPIYDYLNMFDPSGNPTQSPEVFQHTSAVAAQTNGSIVINCYYYWPATTQQFIRIGGFELDLVKGYPVTQQANYDFLLPVPVTNKYVNMLDTMPDDVGITREVPTDVFVQNLKKTPYRNLRAVQMGLWARYLYLQDVRAHGLHPLVNLVIDPSGMFPFFYQDAARSYYVEQIASDDGNFFWTYLDEANLVNVVATQGAQAALAILVDVINKTDGGPTSRYFNFYHPLMPYFIKQLFFGNIDGLMARATQLKGDFAYDPNPDPAAINFQTYLSPDTTVYAGRKVPVTYPNGKQDTTPGYPKEDVDFNLQSGYGLYNWELFFHAPLMIAERLSMNQQFDDADRWYRYIFNPMDTSNLQAPDKYWNTKPFFLNIDNKYVNQRLENILKGVDSATLTNDPNGLLKDVSDWRANPFQPHLIAEYRTVAYQKVAVMKYIGHLIRYGDYLFSQSTMESVNEATQLYILASEILGPKPQIIPSAVQTGTANYYQLQQKLDALSNAMVDVENLVPGEAINVPTPKAGTPAVPSLQTLYFGIPINEKLVGPTGYWDVVADRLFKIRHCLNIDGQAVSLSLFAPPIDPGMLVRAAAAGISLGSILADTNGPLPLYRFPVMIQKAMDLAGEVKSLGMALMSALEKKDGETIALLRSSHEIKLTTAVLAVKQKQVDEAQNAIDNLNKQKELVTIRQQYYTGLLNGGLSSNESGAITLNYVSIAMEAIISEGTLLAGGIGLIPNFIIGASGFGGSPHAVGEVGGDKLSKSGDLAMSALGAVSRGIDKTASLMLTKSGYDRRAAEWKFQLDLANKELDQLDTQLKGAQIRLDIANNDLNNQQLQIDQSREMDDLMHSKFTNEDLFTWMSNQLSTVYFKSYQLAYDVARRSERGFRYELGVDNTSYINFGYWDSLKKGLLAGEQLTYDLKRMEMDYLSMNIRELELTKPVSLSQLDPAALLKLKTTGDCWFALPEELFDMDYPGHYMRRVKAVSVTIPCVSGPYTALSCTLTMTKHSVRVNPSAGGGANGYPRALSNGVPADDLRFRDGSGALQSIATSTGQNDPGLFELNFRDDRYLPFEGAGAISLWHLQLPAAVRQFDYNTISDVIIHLRYTARDGGEVLRAAATGSLNSQINQMLVSVKDKGLMRTFSAKNDLPTEWYRFLHPVADGDDQVLNLMLDASRFPLFVQGRSIKIVSVEVAADTSVATASLQLVAPGAAASGAGDPLNLAAGGVYGKWLNGSVDYSATPKDPGLFVIKNPAGGVRLKDTDWKNVVIIVRYTVS